MSTASNAPEAIVEKLDIVTDLSKKTLEKYEATGRELIELKSSIGKHETANAETQTKIADMALQLATLAEVSGEAKAQIEYFSKSLDRPQFGTDKDVADFDHKSSEDIARHKHVLKNESAEGFTFDRDMILSSTALHGALNKMMRSHSLSEFLEKRALLNDLEKKAISIATIGQGFMLPQMLDILKDCNIICASIVDLYDTIQVARPTFKFPVIADYGKLGYYGCADDCAATFGQDANITIETQEVKDWRGAFCMHEDVIKYASFDFMQIMVESIERSRIITQNQALIAGDGKNEPMGWAKANKFPIFTTAEVGGFTPQDLRLFMCKGPVEFGKLTAVMHNYVFAYMAAHINSYGEFIFGQGDMGFNAQSIPDIRVTKCLPDATANNSLNGGAAPFVSGSFLMTIADWKLAYKRWVLEPMTVRPNFVTGPYCQQWTFRERSGGSVFCANAGHTLTVR